MCRYENLLELGSQRKQKLEESCKAYQLVREAGELAQWITDKVCIFKPKLMLSENDRYDILLVSFILVNVMLKSMIMCIFCWYLCKFQWFDIVVHIYRRVLL